MARGDDPDSYSMSFGDHLDELRRRVLWALAIPFPLFIVTCFFGGPIIEWLYRPLGRVLEPLGLPTGLQVLGPAETLATYLKLGLIAAVTLSAPWIFWQVWLFVRPGLYRRERRFMHLLVPLSAVLTAAGIGLMYYVMLPLMLQVLVLFADSLGTGPAAVDDPRLEQVLASADEVPTRLADPAEPRPGEVWFVPERGVFAALPVLDASGNVTGAEVVRVPRHSLITQEFRLTTYVNFVLLLMLGIVIAFQMPLVVLLMGWLGLVTTAWLRAKRKYALFVCAVVAAVVTPADALSMIMMLIPLYGLYELSIVMLEVLPARAVAEGNVLARLRRPWRHSPERGRAAAGRNSDLEEAERGGRRERPDDRASRAASDHRGSAP